MPLLRSATSFRESATADIDPLSLHDALPIWALDGDVPALVDVPQDVGAILGEHPAERRGGDRAQRHQCAREGAQPRCTTRVRAARLPRQLHPQPPPTDPVAPRAPSRVSNTCCRYVPETGSRLKDMMGSAKCSRS